MATMSVQKAVNIYGANPAVPVAPQPRSERGEQNQTPSQTDKALTVTISEEAKARQTQEATLQAESVRNKETERAVQQRSQQVQDSQPVAGKPGKRLDITV